MSSPAAVYRHFDGVVIEGARVQLGLYPEHDGSGRFRIAVTALPAATGYERGAAMEDGEATAIYFLRDEIKLHGAVLECLSTVADYLPEYRQGFTLVLEEGMPALVNEWLPKLALAGQVASDLAAHYALLSGRPAHFEPYLNSRIAYTVIAVLFGAGAQPVEDLIASELIERGEDLAVKYPVYAAFMRSAATAEFLRARLTQQSTP